MKKIKAYTIMELIVVMVLSMIVISITYKTLDIVLSQYREFKVKSDRIQEKSLLEILFTKDFQDSDYILRIPDGIACKYKNKRVVYTLENGSILRYENSVIDSFKVKPENINYQFLNRDVKEFDKYIDQLTFEINDSEGAKFLIYRKMYAADFLLEGVMLNKIE